MRYTHLVIKGVSWVGAFRFSTRVIALLRTAVLARILVPAQFGLFGIVTLILSLLEILTETGMNVFLIQEKKALDKYIDTAWVVSIARGILISLTIILAAPLVSSFFKSASSYNLIILSSIVPLVRGFINPGIVKFQKNLEFRKEFYLKFAIFVVDSSVALIVGIVTRSAEALVWGLIAGAILEVFLSFYFVKPVPRPAFDFLKIKKVVSRGKWVTMAGIFDYLFGRGDDIVVGRLLGEGALGIYQNAYKISTLPISEVSDVVSRVTFPLYVKISSDAQRVKRAFVKTTLTISGLVVPLGLAIFLFSPEIVLIVLGSNWTAAIPVLRVLSIFGIVKAVSDSAFALFLALKKQEIVMTITFVSILGLALTIVPFILRFGIVGAGLSALVGSLVSLPLTIYYLLKIFKELDENSSSSSNR